MVVLVREQLSDLRIARGGGLANHRGRCFFLCVSLPYTTMSLYISIPIYAKHLFSVYVYCVSVWLFPQRIFYGGHMLWWCLLWKSEKTEWRATWRAKYADMSAPFFWCVFLCSTHLMSQTLLSDLLWFTAQTHANKNKNRRWRHSNAHNYYVYWASGLHVDRHGGFLVFWYLGIINNTVTSICNWQYVFVSLFFLLCGVLVNSHLWRVCAVVFYRITWTVDYLVPKLHDIQYSYLLVIELNGQSIIWYPNCMIYNIDCSSTNNINIGDLLRFASAPFF